MYRKMLVYSQIKIFKFKQKLENSLGLGYIREKIIFRLCNISLSRMTICIYNLSQLNVDSGVKQVSFFARFRRGKINISNSTNADLHSEAILVYCK